MADGKSEGEDHSQQELEKRVYHLKTLHDVCQEIGFLKGTEEILQTLLAMTMGTFGSLGGLAVLLDTAEGRVETATSRGIEGDIAGDLSSSVDPDFLLQFKNSDRIEILGVVNETEEPQHSGLFELLDSAGIRIWAPFEVDERLKGGIGLGEKLIGEPYSQDDQELLYTLASQGAVSVKNALLIEKMRKDEVIRTNLSRYLSPQVVEKVMNHDLELNLGGKRKEVTILFSDIREFTSMTETSHPDQLMHVLNKYFSAMANCIFGNQGVIDKFIGDAIMAVFGGLINLENPARNAVRAAVEMMEILPGLNEEWAKEFDGFSMEIGVGVASGEVFLGNIGSPERMEYTAIGDTVNVASRFSGIAKGGQVLVCRETHDLLGGTFKYKKHNPMSVKGKSAKLEVFEIHC